MRKLILLLAVAFTACDESGSDFIYPTNHIRHAEVVNGKVVAVTETFSETKSRGVVLSDSTSYKYRGYFPELERFNSSTKIGLDTLVLDLPKGSYVLRSFAEHGNAVVVSTTYKTITVE